MVLSDMKKLGHRCCLLVVINLATCFACASGSFVCTRPPLTSPLSHPHSRCHFPSPACYISIKQALTGNRGTPGILVQISWKGRAAVAVRRQTREFRSFRSAQARLFLWPELYHADGPTGPCHTLLGCVLDVRFRGLQCQKGRTPSGRSFKTVSEWPFDFHLGTRKVDVLFYSCASL